MLVWIKEGAKATSDRPVSNAKPVLTANEFKCKKTGIKKLLTLEMQCATQITNNFPLQLMMKF